MAVYSIIHSLTPLHNLVWNRSNAAHPREDDACCFFSECPLTFVETWNDLRLTRVEK